MTAGAPDARRRPTDDRTADHRADPPFLLRGVRAEELRSRATPPMVRQPSSSSSAGITATVLFPLVWVVTISLDPLNSVASGGLNLIPSNATLDAYAQVIAQPTYNPISFLELALNSLKIAIGTSAISVRSACSPRTRFAASVPRPGGADDRGPRRADAAAGGDDHAVVRLAQPVPDRPRRPVVQPAQLAAGGRPWRSSRPSCRSRSGTSRATSTRSRGTSRRRPASTAPARTRCSSRSSCRSPSRPSR